MRSITILLTVIVVSLSAQNVSAQSLFDKLIPILGNTVGSEKDSPKAAPVAVKPPTPSTVVKKVVDKVKGGTNPIRPDVIESSPPSSIESDVPSSIESDVPSMIISDVPSGILSDAPSDIGSNFPSFAP